MISNGGILIKSHRKPEKRACYASLNNNRQRLNKYVAQVNTGEIACNFRLHDLGRFLDRFGQREVVFGCDGVPLTSLVPGALPLFRRSTKVSPLGRSKTFFALFPDSVRESLPNSMGSKSKLRCCCAGCCAAQAGLSQSSIVV